MIFNYYGNDKDILDKDELVVGQTYKGLCRNASEAVWLGEGYGFEYTRHKFGDSYKERIPHPADFNGFDVFLPLRKSNEGLSGETR